MMGFMGIDMGHVAKEGRSQEYLKAAATCHVPFTPAIVPVVPFAFALPGRLVLRFLECAYINCQLGAGQRSRVCSFVFRSLAFVLPRTGPQKLAKQLSKVRF
jgi:hypothetical protein